MIDLLKSVLEPIPVDNVESDQEYLQSSKETSNLWDSFKQSLGVPCVSIDVGWYIKYDYKGVRFEKFENETTKKIWFILLLVQSPCPHYWILHA